MSLRLNGSIPFLNLTRVSLHFTLLTVRAMMVAAMVGKARAFILRSNPGDKVVMDTVFVWLCSMFSFYLVCQGIITQNIYVFDLAIVILIHNAILMLLVDLNLAHPGLGGYNLSLKIYFWSYVVEAVYALCVRYLQRAEINLFLFKKIGANPKINSKCP